MGISQNLDSSELHLFARLISHNSAVLVLNNLNEAKSKPGFISQPV